MEPRINYTVVGIFVVVLTAGLIAGILWLSAGIGTRDYQYYLAYTSESVSGLNVNAPVKYRGVDVGFVREIGLHPDSPEEVRLLLAIEVGTPVKVDTVAILSVQGLTGIAFIDLAGGTAAAPLLDAQPGEAYPVIPTGPSLLARLDTAASQMFTNIERISDSIYALIDEDSQEAFRESLQQIRSFTAKLDLLLDEDSMLKMDETIAGLHTLSTSLAGQADDLARVLETMAAVSDEVPEAIATLNRSARSLERMGDSLHEAGEQITMTMRESQAEVRYVSQHITPDAVAAISDLRDLSVSLERFVQELERDPALLIHGRRDIPRGPGE